MLLCEYGCGNKATNKTKGGKNICSQHTNSCPAIRAKNSLGLQKAYKVGSGTVVSVMSKYKVNFADVM